VYLKALLPLKTFEIISVRQFRTKKTTTATYNVRMRSKEDSDEIRSAFGVILKNKAKSGKHAPPVPTCLTGVTLAISHTFTTRIRVRVMREMARLHHEANPELSTYVTNYLPRPCLRVRHQSGKVDNHLYVDAVKRFSHYLSRDFLAQETTYAKSVGLEHLQSLFLVLSPDLIQAGVPVTPEVQSGSKRGSDHLEDKQPPPKKVPGHSTSSQAKGTAKGKGRGKKTGASATASPLATSNSFAALAALAEASPDLDRSFTAADHASNLVTDPAHADAATTNAAAPSVQPVSPNTSNTDMDE